MNLKIKFRESFRPFAPAVLRSQLPKWFKFDQSSPYMLITTEVIDSIRTSNSKEKSSLEGLENINAIRSSLPAITHVDYSARIQTVEESTNSIFQRYYKDFTMILGVQY